MDQEEEKGLSGPKPRYVWDPKKLAWVEITEAATEEPASEKAAVEPKSDEVLEEAKVEARAEEVAGEAVVEGAPAEAVAEAVGPQYRGAGIRLVAFIFDAIVLMIIGYLFNQVSGSQSLINAASGEAVNRLTWQTGVFIGILLVYFVGFWAWRGQTPGKMLMGAKIVKNDGGKIGIGRALLRFIVYFLYLMVGGFGLLALAGATIVALVIVALNKRKRGIHDFIAGTVVVDSRAPAPQLVEAEASSASEVSEPPVASEPETDKQE